MMRVTGGLVRASAACLAAGAVALGAGCGGGDDEPAAAQKPAAAEKRAEPAADEHAGHSHGPGEHAEPGAPAPREVVARAAKLLASSKPAACRKLDAIATGPETELPCPAPPKLADSMAQFEILGGERLGTGALVEYRSGAVKDSAAVVLLRTAGAVWEISRFGLFAERSVGTSDGDSRAGFDRAIGRYLAAVRERDCRAFYRLVSTEGQPQRVICATLFAKTQPLADRLSADPEAAPEYEGGNSVFGFYTVTTDDPEPQRHTLAVMRDENPQGAPYIVVGTTLSPTAE